MYTVETTKQFDKSFKRCLKRNLDPDHDRYRDTCGFILIRFLFEFFQFFQAFLNLVYRFLIYIFISHVTSHNYQ